MPPSTPSGTGQPVQSGFGVPEIPGGAEAVPGYSLHAYDPSDPNHQQYAQQYHDYYQAQGPHDDPPHSGGGAAAAAHGGGALHFVRDGYAPHAWFWEPVMLCQVTALVAVAKFGVQLVGYQQVRFEIRIQGV